MLIVVNSVQLVPFVERAIKSNLSMEPENLKVEPGFYGRLGDQWEFMAEFDAGDCHHRMRMRLDSSTGKVLCTEED
jgi:hypothetical protein